MPGEKQVPSWDDLPDAPPGWDDLPEEKSSPPAPLNGDEKSTLGKVLEFGSDVINKDIPQAGKNIYDTVKAGAGAVISIPSILKRASELSQGNNSVDTIHAIMQAVGEKLPDMDPDQKKALMTKMAGGGIGGAVGVGLAPETGGASLLLPPVLAALGMQGGQEASEEMGFEPDTPAISSDKAHLLIQSLLTNVLTEAPIQAMGQGLSKVGGFVKGKTAGMESVKDALVRGNPDHIIGQLTWGSKTAAGESPITSQMREGMGTFSRVFLDEMPNAKNAVDAVQKLKAAITRRYEIKQGIFESLASKAKGTSNPDAFLFSEGDLGLRSISRKIKETAETGIGGDAAAVQSAVLGDIRTGFQKQMPQPTGGYSPVPIKKSFQQMQVMLDRTYEELRKLKLFDARAQGVAGVTPSQMAQVADRIEVYGDLASKIKTAMASKMEKLAKSGLIEKGTAEKFARVNSEMSDLQPFVPAFERFSDSSLQALTKDPPRSLVQKNGSIFNRNESTIGQALNRVAGPITSGFLEKGNLESAANFAPNSLSEIQKSAELMTGRRSPANPISSWTSGAGQVTGKGMQLAGSALETASDPRIAGAISAGVSAPSWNGDDFDSVVSQPGFVQTLVEDPDISDETKRNFTQSTNATQWEKNKALGQLKIEARDKGWFPPPPMQGIHSFIKVPNATYQGEKVLGTITDQAEGGIYLDAVNQIPDIEKRAKLKSAFNSQGKYVLEVPNSLKPVPKPEKAPVKAEPVMKEESQDIGSKSVPSLHSGQGNMNRIVHDY